jgi:type 1 glutamine amidotransferase
VDRSDASVSSLPDTWQKSDEFYFVKQMYPGIHVVLASDIGSLGPQDSAHIREAQYPFADYYPSAWHQAFDGGTVWVTTLGHDSTDYRDATYLQLLRGGLRYAAAHARALDARTAYATSRDTPLP